MRRMRSVDKLHKEMRVRQNLRGYHAMRRGGVCGCDDCVRRMGEVKEIEAIIATKAEGVKTKGGYKARMD